MAARCGPSGQHHAYPERTNVAPIFGNKRSLGIQGRGDGIRRGGKCHLHRVADGLEVDALVGSGGYVKAVEPVQRSVVQVN